MKEFKLWNHIEECWDVFKQTSVRVYDFSHSEDSNKRKIVNSNPCTINFVSSNTTVIVFQYKISLLITIVVFRNNNEYGYYYVQNEITYHIPKSNLKIDIEELILFLSSVLKVDSKSKKLLNSQLKLDV